MLVQDNTKEKPVTGAFGAAAAAREAVQVSSLHKKCNELALLPRTVFGASKNATARRNYSMEKKQRESAERLFVRIQKAVDHPDSCFFNKKQRKQLTSMCLQLSTPSEQQQEAKAASVVPDALAAAAKVQVAELKSILKTAGLDCGGLKVPLLQRVQKNNLMHKLGDRTAAEALLKNYEKMQLDVGQEEAAAEEQQPCAEEQQVPAEHAAGGEGAAPDAVSDNTAPEETAAEPTAPAAVEPAAEIALAHISDFYTTSTEGNKERTWDLNAWQAMVQSNCPELQLLPT